MTETISFHIKPHDDVMIPNIWDAPLDEIAATLNEYRERVVGGKEWAFTGRARA